jgi:hypothetical protein
MSKVLAVIATVLTLFSLSACVVAPVGPPRPVAYAYGPGYAYAPGYAVYPAPVAVGFAGCWRCGWRRW